MSACIHQIALTIMLLLVNKLKEKNVIESQDRHNFDICNLYSCYMKNAPVSANQTYLIFARILLATKYYMCTIMLLTSKQYNIEAFNIWHS